MARVVDDEDLDAFEWDTELGWLSTAVFAGGTLDGEGDVLVRTASPAQGDGVGYYYPPRATGLVATTIPTADPNDLVVAVGQLHNTDETAPALAPTTINGDAIVEREASEGQVAAAETHMAVFPDEDLDQEWRNARITVSDDAESPGQMVLVAPDADQSGVRGDDQADALDDLADAMSDIVTAINTALAAVPTSIDPASLAAFELAIETFKNAREQYLSSRLLLD
jgi:hypothetical protein